MIDVDEPRKILQVDSRLGLIFLRPQVHTCAAAVHRCGEIRFEQYDNQ